MQPLLWGIYAHALYVTTRIGPPRNFCFLSLSRSIEHLWLYQGRIYSYGEEGMQLVEPSKFASVTIFRTHSIGSIGMRTCNWGYVAIFSNTNGCTASTGVACPLLRRSIYALGGRQAWSFWHKPAPAEAAAFARCRCWKL